MDEMTNKELPNYLDERINLVKKIDLSKDKEYKPTEEELEKAYGYLNYCIDCGRPLIWADATTHCFLGNHHKFGCSKPLRLVSIIYKIILLPLVLIGILIYPFIIFKRVLSGEKCGGW